MTSSTADKPPMKTDDEEVIERVLERNVALLKGVNVPGGLTGGQWRHCCDDQAADAPDLARRLRERNARIAVLEKQLGEASAALLATIDGGEHVGIIGALIDQAIADARTRTRKGDHRG